MWPCGAGYCPTQTGPPERVRQPRTGQRSYARRGLSGPPRGHRTGCVPRIAKAWADNGWPAEPDESGSGITAPFNAPSQGPPPWNVYRIEPRSSTVVSATEPGGLTRFRF